MGTVMLYSRDYKSRYSTLQIKNMDMNKDFNNETNYKYP